MLKTYIIFDTNILYQKKYEDYSKFKLNQVFGDIRGKIERNDVESHFELLVPDITLNELFQQQVEKYEENYNSLISSYLTCKQLYSIDLKIDEAFNYKSYLNEIKDQYIKANNINILNNCSQSRFSNIVNRALNKQAPFLGEKGNSDKGFKDAVIWESILEFAINNEGEYIFLTHDKGFKDYLFKEFKEVTNKSITIYNKDQLRELDVYIEKYSSEQNIIKKLNIVQQNIELVFHKFLTTFKHERFNEIKVNGTLCKVTNVDFNNEIIDLNEVGESEFKFKFEGLVRAEKPGLMYELNLLIEILVSADLLNDEIETMKLENIEATLPSGDFMTVEIPLFDYNPLKDFYESEMEEEIENETEKEAEGSATQFIKVEKQVRKEDPYHVEFVKKFIGSLAKEKYDEIFEGKIEIDEIFINELLQTIESNITIDWLNFHSRVAQMRISLKAFLKRHNFENSLIDVTVVEIIKQLEVDYKKFTSREVSEVHS